MLKYLGLLVTLTVLTCCGGGSGGETQTASPSSGSTSSGVNSPGSASSPAACAATPIRDLFERNNCLGCHNAQAFATFGGDLNLDTGNVGQNMLARATAHGGAQCQSELLIDPNNTANSLILKLTHQQQHQALTQTGCSRQPMPATGNYMSSTDHACLTQWVEHIAKTETPLQTNPEDAPFQALTAAEALAKSKLLLSGLAPTAEELASLGGAAATPTPASLKALISEWETTDAYKIKISQFLGLALQQNTSRYARYLDQFNNLFSKTAAIDSFALIDNYKQMFTRTAWDIVENNNDFRQVISTREWKITTAALVGLIYLDKENQTQERNYLRNPLLKDRLRSFEHFTASDYNDWRTIEITQSNSPYNYQNSATFAASIRAIPDGGSIALLFPRVGFFNTPSFFELWATNDDNDFRVTTQQTLITALDLVFDPADTTPHFSEVGIPPEHTGPSSACYQCHRLMDPMRLIFKNTQVSRNRAKPPATAMQPTFSLAGVTANMTTMDEFAQIISNHPTLPSAWVQKLCMWGNSQKCDAQDPEFQRIADFFKAQNFNLKLLIREFFSSPLFSATQLTKTHQSHTYLVSLNRANHFCQAIDARVKTLNRINGTLGSLNQCDQDGNFGIVQPDIFARGNTDFVQTTKLSAFNAKSIDRVCGKVAKRVFANGTNRVINRADGIEAALEQLVQVIMGIPTNHPRYNVARAQLQRTFDISFNKTPCPEGVNPAAQNTVSCGYGNNESRALQAAWFAACTSPDTIAIGM